MSQFAYRAVDANGHIVRGRMQANNEMDIELRLSRQQQELISCRPIKARGTRWLRRRLKRPELINMVFQLEQLTRSGVPLLDGLRDLRDMAPPGYFRDVMNNIVESIEGGKTFSAALAEFPNDFDSVFIALIEIGEESGELPKILADMGKTLRWTDELVAATVKIITYPAIVGVVVLAVAAFLMIYLVPKILPFVAQMGTEIPAYTTALIATSDFVIRFWWILLCLPFVIISAIKIAARRSRKIRLLVDGAKLRLPLIGDIIFKIKLARLTSYMALLYASGITVLRSLDICQALVGNTLLAQAVNDVRGRIEEGKTISESFELSKLFPPLVIRMVKVGEQTGKLDESLLNVSYFFNREAQERIDKIEPAINPLLTVTMGLLLGWIMFSVLGPVWQAVGSIGA